jgi:hypothetical protein
MELTGVWFKAHRLLLQYWVYMLSMSGSDLQSVEGWVTPISFIFIRDNSSRDHSRASCEVRVCGFDVK